MLILYRFTEKIKLPIKPHISVTKRQLLAVICRQKHSEPMTELINKRPAGNSSTCHSAH